MGKQEIKYMVERSKDGQFYVNIVKGGKVLFTSETYYNKRAGAMNVAKSMGGTQTSIVDNTADKNKAVSLAKSLVKGMVPKKEKVKAKPEISGKATAAKSKSKAPKKSK